MSVLLHSKSEKLQIPNPTSFDITQKVKLLQDLNRMQREIKKSQNCIIHSLKLHEVYFAKSILIKLI